MIYPENIANINKTRGYIPKMLNNISKKKKQKYPKR